MNNLGILIVWPSILILLGIFSGIARTARVSFRQTRITVSLYLAVLLIFTGAFYLVADAKEAASAQDIQVAEAEAEAMQLQFYAALEKGRLSKLEGIQINGYWNFTYYDDVLYLTTAADQYFEPLVAIERKEINDGKIDVTSYTTSLKFKGDLLGNSPSVRRIDNKLELTNAAQFEMVAFAFTKDWTMQQFSDSSNNWHWNMSSLLGAQAVVIQVPKDLQVEVEVEQGLNLVP
ncbi:MAG TPA: hypothetical protein VFC74_04265 [Oscillospiraceae bacterium]|nr:hypothetical protein [Oscillospiraceae bacterium]